MGDEQDENQIDWVMRCAIQTNTALGLFVSEHQNQCDLAFGQLTPNLNEKCAIDTV